MPWSQYQGKNQGCQRQTNKVTGVGRAEAPQRTGATTRLIEREPELEAIARLLRAAAGGEGGFGLIEGVPGIGKSALLGVARTRAADQGLHVLTARGRELEIDFPFGVVRQLFDPVLAALDPGERDETMAGAPGLAEAVFGHGPAAGQVDPGYGILHGLFWLTSNLADQAPLLISIDDLHWADPASLRFVGFLANRIEGLSALVLAGSRGSGTDERTATLLDGLRLDPSASLVTPPALTRAGTGELVMDAGGERLAALADVCHELTGGNPFLLQELVREIRSTSDGSELSEDDVRELGPERIGTAALKRIGRLPPGADALARAVAILGDDVSLETAGTLASLEPAQASGFADQLDANDVFASGRPLRFEHPIVRSAVYLSIPETERSRAHLAAAALLRDRAEPVEVVAGQLRHTEPAADPAVVKTLVAAAEEALSRGAAETAVGLLERAMREPPPQSDRAALLLMAGKAAKQAALDSAIPFLEQATASPHDAALGAEIAAELGELLSVNGRDHEALPIFAAALDRARAEGLEEEAGRLTGTMLVLANAFPGTRREMRPHMEAALAAVEQEPSPSPVLDAHGAAEYALVVGPAEKAIKYGRRAHEGGLIAMVTADAPPVYLGIVGLWCSDLYAEADHWFTVALDDARRRGSAIAFVLASTFRSVARQRAGRLAAAESDANAAVGMGLTGGWTGIGTVVSTATLIHVLIARGELDAADELTPELEGKDVRPELALTQQLRHAVAELRRVQGREAEALALFELVAGWERAWGGGTDTWVRWRQGAALAHFASGSEAEAQRLARESVELARGYGAPGYLGTSLRVAASVGAADSPIETLRESVAVLTASEARLEHARSLIDLGTLLHGAGDLDEARGLLAKAQDLARETGATAVEREALDLLVAAGARPRRVRQTGAESLTAAELRVAEMAAEGMSNREVAQSLFVTQKTVETHLGRCYRKLGIGSRGQLKSRLHAQSESA